VLGVWFTERVGQPNQPLFPTRTGGRLSRDAIEHRVTKHATTAASTCVSLQGRKSTTHVLRHTAAITLLHAGIDSTVIALWLGHEQVATTQIYLNADLALKERAPGREEGPRGDLERRGQTPCPGCCQGVRCDLWSQVRQGHQQDHRRRGRVAGVLRRYDDAGSALGTLILCPVPGRRSRTMPCGQ
jgi:hypothetical protein